MKEKYYNHFQLLAYAAIYSEMRLLTTDRLNKIKILLDLFLEQFPLLYGVRLLAKIFHSYIFFSLVFKESNCISVVHSVAHIYQTLVQFVPIFNYSTFNFESAIGKFTCSYGTEISFSSLNFKFEDEH